MSTEESKKQTQRKGVPKMETPPKPPRKNAKEQKPRKTKNNPLQKTRNERALEVLQLVENKGFSVLKACDEVMLSRGEFFAEIDSSPEMTNKYTRARERRSDMLLEEIIEIADDQNDDKTPYYGDTKVKRANLRIETRIKYIKTLHPNKYGDKLDLKHSGEIEVKTITGMIIENNTSTENNSETNDN
jgi:hypothetical protein